MIFQTGEKVGDYEITAVLGAGGMGEVYQVEHTITRRAEALKVVKANMRDNPELAERFLREVRLHAALKHPNITDLHTAVWAGPQLAMVMELVEGRSLENRMLRGPRLTPEECVDIAQQTLSALAYAHSKQIVHRDIKPSNIMLTDSGQVKVMDFGVARGLAQTSLTMTGLSVGTPAYMSPEQFQGEDIDGRSDIYSVAAMLYEMLSGERPFRGATTGELAAHKLERDPEPLEAPGVSPALAAAVMRGLARRREDRYADAEAFARDLTEALKTAPAPAPAAPAKPAPEPQAAPAPGPEPAPSRGDRDDDEYATLPPLPGEETEPAASPPRPRRRERKPLPPWLKPAAALITVSAALGFTIPWIASQLTGGPEAEPPAAVAPSNPEVGAAPEPGALEEPAPAAALDPEPSAAAPEPPAAAPRPAQPEPAEPPGASVRNPLAPPPPRPEPEPEPEPAEAAPEPVAEPEPVEPEVAESAPPPAPEPPQPEVVESAPPAPAPTPKATPKRTPTPQPVDEPPDGIYTIGGDVSSPQLIHKVQPDYSEAARQADAQGAVRLRVVIDAQGVPEDVEVLRGLHPDLDRNAVAAVRQWRFSPARKQGAGPVKVAATVDVQFRLFDRPPGAAPSLGGDK